MAATGAAQLRPKPGLFLWGHFDDNLGGHGRFSSAVRLMCVVPVSLNETAAALNPLLLCPISLWTDLVLRCRPAKAHCGSLFLRSCAGICQISFFRWRRVPGPGLPRPCKPLKREETVPAEEVQVA